MAACTRSAQDQVSLYFSIDELGTQEEPTLGKNYWKLMTSGGRGLYFLQICGHSYGDHALEDGTTCMCIHAVIFGLRGL